MKLDLKELKRAMAVARNIAPARSPMDIIKYVLVRCAGSKAIVFSTDTEIFGACSVKCEGATGDFCIEASKLSEICSAANDDPDFRVDGNFVAVKVGRSTIRIPTISPDTFPSNANTDVELCKIDSASLSTCIDSTIFATGADLRLSLDGLNIKSIGGKLHIRAFDGSGIGVSAETICSCGEIDEVVPSKAIKSIRLMLNEDEVKISTSPGRITFANSWARISTKLLAGKFPPIEKVLSKASWFGKFDPDELRRLCQQAKILNTEETVGIELTIEDENMKFVANSRAGAMEAETKIEGADDTFLRIGVEYLSRGICGDEMWIERDRRMIISGTKGTVKINSMISGRCDTQVQGA